MANKGEWKIPKEKVIEVCRELQAVNPHKLSKRLGVNRATAERYIEVLEKEKFLIPYEGVWIVKTLV